MQNKQISPFIRRKVMPTQTQSAQLRLASIVLILSLILGLPGGQAAASAPIAETSAAPQAAGKIPIANLLNPDGSLDLSPGQYGSIDLSGWQMVSGMGEAPRFAPLPPHDPQPPAGAPGDENWAEGFHLPGVDGEIYALALDSSGSLYAGGRFNVTGDCTSNCNNIAKWDGANWSALGSGTYDPYSGGDIYALAVDSSGNLYAGGDFTSAGDCIWDCARIAKWDGANWSALETGMDGWVSALAVDSSDNLYAGGEFYTAGNCTTNCRHIAKWDGNTWSTLGTGIGGDIYALTFDGNGNLYAGGEFISAGSCTTNCNYIARWDGANWNALETGMDDQVRALAADSSGNLYAGGWFSSAGSCTTDCRYIARWDGSTWSALGAGMNDYIYALAVDDRGNLYAGGMFDNAGNCTTNCNRIAQWDGVNWSGLGTGMNNAVMALTFDAGGDLYAGGWFRRADGVTAMQIAAWNDASWSALGTAGNGLNSSGYALAVDSSGNLYAGGGFTTAGNCTTDCNYIAKWDGANWSALGAGMNGWVSVLAFDSNGDLYAGGGFTTAGNCLTNCNHIARWDGSTWSALGTGMNDVVTALAFGNNGNLYAGGEFTGAGSCDMNCQHIAKWNGANWSALSIGMNGFVYALAVDSKGNLYAGGNFTRAGGCNTNCNYLARWNGANWSALGTGMDSKVDVLAFDGSGNLYAGGHFTRAGSCTTNCERIAKWNGVNWSALGTRMSGSNVNALAFDSSGNLYAGGEFNEYGDWEAGRNIARWDGTGWNFLGTGIDYYTVNTLAVDSSGNLYAGGHFSRAGNTASFSFAQWTAADAACGLVAGGSYTLYAGNLPVSLHINAPGDIDCLSAQRFNTSHPNAGTAQQTGYYWSFNAVNAADGPASGFDIDLTLPFAAADANDSLCRWTGSTWNCLGSGGSGEVTRNHVTQFSDWAVGDDAPLSLPEMDVLNQGISIANGDNTPSIGDGTGFGEAPIFTLITHTFTISNTGYDDLLLSGAPAVSLAAGAHFSLTVQPANPLPSGASTTFEIVFAPTAAGYFTDTLVIPNNDPDENPYTFLIAGAGQKIDTATAILTDLPDPSVIGQPYTITASVTAQTPGAGTPGGTVDVDDGEGNTCQITLADGQGACSLVSIIAGPKTLTASYRGEARFNPSTATAAHTVNETLPLEPPLVLTPAEGALSGSLQANWPIFSGSAGPGLTVTVMEDSTILCTSVSEADGSWQCASQVRLNSGPHTIAVIAASTDGRLSLPALRSFIVPFFRYLPLICKPEQ